MPNKVAYHKNPEKYKTYSNEFYLRPGRREAQAKRRRFRYLNEPGFRERCIRESKEQTIRNRIKSRKFVDALKASSPCADCGRFFNPECMDFDHLPGYKKVRDIAQSMGASLGKLKKEIAKCELVCACCHRSRTKKRTLTRTPAGAIIPNVT